MEAAGLHGRLKGWCVQNAEDSVRGTGAVEGESTAIEVGDIAHRLGQAQTVVHELLPQLQTYFFGRILVIFENVMQHDRELRSNRRLRVPYCGSAAD